MMNAEDAYKSVGAVTFVGVQTTCVMAPVLGSQRSLVHGSPAGETPATGVPATHTPALHVSTPLQTSPSSQLAPLFTEALHTPPAQVAFARQRLPSAHAVPSG
jgi:hypothetical protein